MLTWQSHASPSRAARVIHGCTTSIGPTILERTPERPAVGRRRRPNAAVEVLAQVRGGAQAVGGGDLVDARVGPLQGGASGVDALRRQPLQDAEAGLGLEAAGGRGLGGGGGGGGGRGPPR